MTRAHINLTTKLASALLALGEIPYSDAKQMTAAQIISLYQFDHGILHGVVVIDEFWNLTPRLITPHRAKSRSDTGVVAKVKRLARVTEEASRRLLAKEPGKSARPASRWPKRKMQSRNTFKNRKPRCR
jgi:hypothetical protein